MKLPHKCVCITTYAGLFQNSLSFENGKLFNASKRIPLPVYLYILATIVVLLQSETSFHCWVKVRGPWLPIFSIQVQIPTCKKYNLQAIDKQTDCLIIPSVSCKWTFKYKVDTRTQKSKCQQRVKAVNRSLWKLPARNISHFNYSFHTF